MARRGTRAAHDARMRRLVGVIARHKHPGLVRKPSERLEASRIEHQLLTECLERSAFLALFAESRVVVCLPRAQEGFHLPALEAMASGALVVTLDCIGNRGPCRHEDNCLVAEPTSESPCSTPCGASSPCLLRRRTSALSCAPRGNRSPLAHGMSKSRTGYEAYRNGAMREPSPWRPSPLRPGPGKHRHGTTDSRNTPPPRRQSVRKGGATPALSRRCPGDVGSEGRPPTLPPPSCAARSRNKARKERIPSARSIARSAPRQPSMPFRQPWGTADEAQHGVSVFASIRKRLVTGQLVRRGNAKAQDHAVPQYVVPLSCTTGGSVQQVRMKQHPLARSERHRLGELRRHSSGIT